MAVTSLALTLALVPGVAPEAFAEDDVIDSGTCGDNLTWVLTSDGTLTISGSGAMEDYSVSTQTGGSIEPWSGYRDTIVSVVIPDSVTSIGAYAFRACTSLSSVSIPDSVTSIGRNAFCVCTSLESLVIPDSVTSIGDYAFNTCTSLVSAVFGSSMTTTGVGTFDSCTSLACVFIPDSIITIESSAFGDCTSLTDVYYGGSGDDWANISIAGDGNTCLTSATIHYDSVASDMPVSIANANVALGKTSYAYDGTAKKPSVTVTLSGVELVRGTDYTVEYSSNKNAGTAKVTVTGTGSYAGSATATFAITKAANTLKVKGKTAKVKGKTKAGKLKKKTTLARAKVLTVTGAKGTVTYKKTSGSKKIGVNAKTGKVTLKKGLKKGSYKVKVKVKASGNGNYKTASKTVTVTIKVK